MNHEPGTTGQAPEGVGGDGPARPPRRLTRVLRWPAAFTAVAAVAALCLHGTPQAQAATARPQAGRTVTTTFRLPRPARDAAPDLMPVSGGSGGGGGTGGTSEPSPGGGLRGAVSMYDGLGGGLEFWFDPTTGELTIAVAAGAGAGEETSLGTYSPGQAPEPGVYSFVNASFSAGSVATLNVGGDYSWANGDLAGSVSGTVEGRTLTLNSNGSSSFTVSAEAEPGAEGWEGSVGVKGVFSFNAVEVVNELLDAIADGIYGDDSVDDDSYSDPGTTTTTTGDNDGGGSVSDDDGTDDGTDDDGTDDGGGGGGGGCDAVRQTAFTVAAHPASHSVNGGVRVKPQLAPVCDDDAGDDDDGWDD